MGSFTGRNLGIIDRLFNFKAGAASAPTEYASESPITPVHELGRPAELAAGYGFSSAPGFAWIGPQHTHAAADTQRSATNPRTVYRANPAIALQVPQQDQEWDVWHLGLVSCLEETSAALITGANAAVWFPPMVGRILPFPLLMWVAGVAVAISDQVGSTNAIVYGANVLAAAGSGRMPTCPFILPVGAVLANTSVSSGATTITIAHLCWAGVKGSRPPGLA